MEGAATAGLEDSRARRLLVTGLLRWVVAAVTVGMAVAIVGLEHDNPGYSVARVLLVAAVGLVMVGAGFAAAANGEVRIGVVVLLAGTSWLVEQLLGAVPSQLALSISGLLPGLWAALIIHAVISFPTGRLRSTLDRALVVAFYVLQVGGQVAIALTIPRFEPRGAVGPNEIVLWRNADLADRIAEFTDRATLPLLLAIVGLLVHRLVTAAPPARRGYGFVWVGGIVLCVNLGVLVSAGLGWVDFEDAYGLWLEYVAGLVPLAMAASLFAARVAEDRLVALVADLGTSGPGVTLRNALRRALGDPSLEVVYLRAGSGGWISELGVPALAPAPVAGRASTPIERGGKPVAALVHDPVLLRHPERLRAAIGATALAIDNEQLKVELRAQLRDVQASRSRIVEAGDRERRRVERNLHDGAQQRLVGLALTLRLAGRTAEADPALTGLLAEAARELDDALEELRELARGIHPAIVTDAGLVGALETLAERPGVPVVLLIDLPERLPEAVEVGAYYLVAEALANANKHAGAGSVTVRASVVDEALHLAVSDDGRGGASARPGSGLEGLADRVSSLAGRLRIESPVGGGTSVKAEIPLRLPGPPAREGRRITALKWIGWESWELPGEVYDQLTDEDNLTYVKALFACAGGVARVTPHERDWVIGYHTAAGDADWVLEEIRTYAGDEPIEELMRAPSMANTGRALLYDALRMCASDGPLTPGELDAVRRAADAMELPRQLVDVLRRVVDDDHAQRRRRYDLITAPVLHSH